MRFPTSSKNMAVSAAPGRPKDAAKRVHILRAASELFLKDGYERTSMEAVAKKADVSKLTIYSHFVDKVELFQNVIRLRCDKLAVTESFPTLRDKPVGEALMEIAMRFITHVLQPESISLHRILQAEALRHPDMARTFYETGPKRVRAAFGELLQHYVDKGELIIADVPKSTEQFFSLIKGERMMKVLLGLEKYPSKADMNKHAKASVGMFLAAYQTHFNQRSKTRR